VEAVVNLTGYGLEHWPWTPAQKRKFRQSRVIPAELLASAARAADRHPRIFLQVSGVNHYGLTGAVTADESTPAADDFLANLTVEWEAPASSLEDTGMRTIIARSAIVLDRSGGLMPLMVMPARLLLGGRLGNGRQAVPWIHLRDFVNSLKFLLEMDKARGAFNLVAPVLTSNADFMRAACRALGRPYWFPVPAVVLRAALGEMSNLILTGRFVEPRRLVDLGFRFDFVTIQAALEDMFGHLQS
jgi:uncharacterized protein (TIGR01777 family)